MERLTQHPVFKWCLGITALMLIYVPTEYKGQSYEYRFITELDGYAVDIVRLVIQIAFVFVVGWIVFLLGQKPNRKIDEPSGVDTNSLAAESASENNWVLDAWRGKQKLWKVFWVYGAGCGLLTGLILIPLSEAAESSFLKFLIVGANIAIYIWLLVSIWKCADNVGKRIWGTLARCSVVGWAAVSAYRLIF